MRLDVSVGAGCCPLGPRQAAKAPKAKAKAAPSLPVALHRNDLRVLLVEDNKDTLRYLAIVLVLQALLHVVTADCVTAALARWLKEAEVPFDLLLSDIELPDGYGLQLMREIQASEPIVGIAMSGFGAEEDLRQSREAGFFDHLTKPIDLTRLDNAIKSATAYSAGRVAEHDSDDASQPFSLRTEGNSSGAFRIVWSAEPKPENSDY